MPPARASRAQEERPRGENRARKPVVTGVAIVVASVLLLAGACASWLRSDGDTGGMEAPATQDEVAATLVGSRDNSTPAGPLPTVLPFCLDESSSLVSYDEGPLGVRASWEVAQGLPDVATQTLQAYEASGDVALHYGGYVDFLGNVWACAVSCPSWVEVVVVQDQGGEEAYVGSHSQGGPCLVSVMRLGQEAIEGAGGEVLQEGAR